MSIKEKKKSSAFPIKEHLWNAYYLPGTRSAKFSKAQSLTSGLVGKAEVF